MFSVGEMVIYGAMGVCRVESICEMDIPGAAREYYLLIPEYVPHSKVYAPVDNNPVEMRGLLSRRQAELLIESFPAIKAFPIKKERAEQYEMYRNVLKSADSTALAKLIKTLHERKRNVAENKKTVPIAEVDVSEMMGSSIHLHVNAGGKDVVIIIATASLPIDKRGGYRYGETVSFAFPGEAVHLFGADGVSLI